MFRRALSGLSLVVLAGAAALVPVAASAGTAELTVTDARVQFSSRQAASIAISYTCGGPDAATDEHFSATVYQPLADDAYRAAADTAPEGVPVTCDGVQHTQEQVPLEVTEGTFANGTAEIAMLIGEDEADVVLADVVVAGIPEPVITLTTNASPEPARKGKKITVKGTVARDDKGIKVKATLYFAKDGDDFAKLKTVKSSSKGTLSTTVKAGRTGTYAYGYAGVVDEGDHLEVIPAVKKYKNCTALNKVYEHGVGRKGAVDKGGSVDDFTVDTATYKKNTKSDRDKDGIACEQR